MGSLVWEDLPFSTRTRLGSLVNGAGGEFIPAGGYSGGVSGFLGESLFIKAVQVRNPASVDYSIEAKVAAALDGVISTPALHFGGIIDDWSILVFDAARGHMPKEPWQPRQLELVLRSLDGATEILTPSPVEGLPTVADRMRGRCTTWRLLLDGKSRDALTVQDLSAWERQSLGRLAGLEARGEVSLSGDTLLHFDLRHDNVLIDDGDVTLLDWGRACIGPAWVDVVCLLLESNTGNCELDELFNGTSRGAIANPAEVDTFLAMLASYWRHSATLPTRDSPGLQARRQYSADATLRWLASRWVS